MTEAGSEPAGSAPTRRAVLDLLKRGDHAGVRVEFRDHLRLVLRRYVRGA